MVRSDGSTLAAELARMKELSGIKWTKYGSDVLPAWVADMDLAPPPAVVERLRTLIDRGDLGYATYADDLPAAFIGWQERHHGWSPRVEGLRIFTSVLHAIEVIIWNATERGDGIVTFTPVYHPFLHAIADSGRRLVDVPLDPDGWRLDPERLAAAIDPGTRIILLCNPHNPTGRVFDRDELDAIADVAERHDLLVISDEIWADLTFDRSHAVLAEVAGDRLAGRLITLGSASKSFSLAGMRCAVAHVDHRPLLQRLAEMPTHLIGAPSTLGVAATLAAWTPAGEAWLDHTRQLLRERRAQLTDRVGRDLPGVRNEAPEGTYLAWLDFRKAGLGGNPSRWLLEHARVALSPGPQFGTGGDGWARLNFATTPAILDQIIDRIARALADR